MCVIVNKINLIYNKNGKGYLTYKINLPLKILKKWGITKEKRTVILEYNEANDIFIIRKEVS